MKIISIIRLLLGLIIIMLLSKIEAWALTPRVPESILSSVGKQFPYIKPGGGEDRIVGGRSALHGEFPYQASIQKQSILGTKTHYCGGALVGQCIVTAAHCLEGRNADDLVVRLGSITLKPDTVAHEYQVEKIIVHPTYDSKTIINDIGILKLSKKIELGANVKPVALPVFKSEVSPSTDCIVTGWGSQREGASISKTLMYATVPTMSDQKCRTFYGKSEIYEGMLCAGFSEGGIDSCQGDSGGPLVCSNNGNNKVLLGIVSWGIGCARPKFPGVYTQVSYYKKWIESHDCFKITNSTQSTVPAKFFSFQLFPFWTE